MVDPLNSSTGITLLGLGPGSPELLTRQAWEELGNCSEIYLRTIHHPVVEHLPAHMAIHSFDLLFEQTESTADGTNQIADVVLAAGRRSQGVVYAVPGHPFFGDATCAAIARQAQLENLPVKVIAGMSILEPVLNALKINPFPQIALVDALELADGHFPPFPSSSPALIVHINSQSLANQIKAACKSIYPGTHGVQMISGIGTLQPTVMDTHLDDIDQKMEIGSPAVLYIPPLGKGTSFEEFAEIIAHLRAPNGCPWDKEQTHLSLRPYLIEETYEVLDTLDQEDFTALQEELGDLLLQILLHSQIASESGEFSIADVLRGIHTKIVGRHPHVFGDVEVKDAAGVLRNWERLKAEEREVKGKSETGALDGVAKALPALIQATEYQKRSARVNYPAPEMKALLEQVNQEINSIAQDAAEEEKIQRIGDILFALVRLAGWLKVEPESALRAANQRFHAQFSETEKENKRNGGLI